jgi:adenosylmethionine-8-amino-7-oxononanoate aminotransferase
VGERIKDLATRQASRLEALARHPRIANARQIGTITAVELRGEDGYLSQIGPRLLAFFGERDLLLRPLGNTVYVMPPYCIDDSDLDHIYAAIAEACDTVGQDS